MGGGGKYGLCFDVPGSSTLLSDLEFCATHDSTPLTAFTTTSRGTSRWILTLRPTSAVVNGIWQWFAQKASGVLIRECADRALRNATACEPKFSKQCIRGRANWKIIQVSREKFIPREVFHYPETLLLLGVDN